MDDIFHKHDLFSLLVNYASNNVLLYKIICLDNIIEIGIDSGPWSWVGTYHVASMICVVKVELIIILLDYVFVSNSDRYPVVSIFKDFEWEYRGSFGGR